MFLLERNPFLFGKKKEDLAGLCCWTQPGMLSSAQDEEFTLDKVKLVSRTANVAPTSTVH